MRAIRSGMLFGFPEGVSGHGGPVAICEDNADLLFGGLDEWRPDVANRLPMAAMVVDGRAVSVCSSVRASQSVHCAGVETVPEHRGRGLAAKAVAAWATMVEATGATPIYGTTFDNLSSQGVIRTLRLQLVASEFSVE